MMLAGRYEICAVDAENRDAEDKLEEAAADFEPNARHAARHPWKLLFVHVVRR